MQRCTKVEATERNRGEAMAIAERWEREAKHLGPALHLANRHAVLETFVTATQKAISGEMTRADAREMLDRRDALLMPPLLLHAWGRMTDASRRRRVLHIEYTAFTLPDELCWHEGA